MFSPASVLFPGTWFSSARTDRSVARDQFRQTYLIAMHKKQTRPRTGVKSSFQFDNMREYGISMEDAKILTLWTYHVEVGMRDHLGGGKWRWAFEAFAPLSRNVAREQAGQRCP